MLEPLHYNKTNTIFKRYSLEASQLATDPCYPFILRKPAGMVARPSGLLELVWLGRKRFCAPISITSRRECGKMIHLPGKKTALKNQQGETRQPI